MRRAAAVDDNQKKVVDALRRAGAYVQHLHQVGNGCPDLLVGFRRQTFLLELKDGAKVPSERKLTDDEKTWHATWRGLPVSVVLGVDDALRAIGATKEEP